MRRSVREALVGFSLLAALASGFGLWFWLKGISLSGRTWVISASFADASGLARRSPVTFRGVVVGHVRDITVTDQAVIAKLEIDDPELRLARPAVARVATASLLGGDAQVNLISRGTLRRASGPGPREEGCQNSRIVCDQGAVSGIQAATLDSITETMQRLLDQAEKEKLVNQIATATRTFERAARETEKLTRDGQGFVGDARVLVRNIDRSVAKTDPILTNLRAASQDAAKASRHVNNITAAFDNPRTLGDLKATISNARQLTARWDAVGGDVNKLTSDPRFIDGMRNVAVGLGKFFEELYPAQTDAARAREQRQRSRQDAARLNREQATARQAPRSRL